MKKYLGFIAVLGMLFISGACSSDEQAVGDEHFAERKYPLEFTVSGLEAVATPAKASMRGTVDGDWTGVTNIPIQIGDEVKIYTVQPSTDGKIATLTSDNPFYWERADETKDVSAWYSARDNYKSTMPAGNYSVKETQSLETFAQDDILWAHQSISFENRENQTLSFRHLLSKLTINLVSTPYLKAHTQNEVSVSLSGNETSTWNIEGIFSGDGSNFVLDEGTNLQSADISPCKLLSPESDTYYATYEALVIPQSTQSGGKVIKVQVGKATYTWAVGLPNSQTKLESGKAYTFNIAVKEHDLEVTFDKNTVWKQDDANGSGSVELP